MMDEESPSSETSHSAEKKTPEPARKTVQKPQPAPREPVPARKIVKEPPVLKNDLDDLDDFFEEDSVSTPDTISLPSGESKKELRTIRRADEAASSASKPEKEEDEEKTPEPQKKQRLRKTSEKTAARSDELGSLDDDDAVEEKKSSPGTVELKKTTAPVKTSTAEPPAPVGQKNEEPASLKALIKNALGSLSLLEQASIGLLVLTLLIAGIWSASVVSARIPNTIIASKLKFPLKGDSVVIADFKSYWRTPIREGESIDEGVSESIEVIPIVSLTLDKKSKAKSLRFLFRDEEGRYVGDSTTVTMSGSNFLPAEDVTALTKGKTAIVRSTTGFEHEGELISYLADENFQWEIVILESKDGENYTEFMTIPISANRNDKS